MTKDYAFILTRPKKQTNWEKKFYITAFILGVITYLFIPKDWQIANIPVPPQNTITGVISDENGCITYQALHSVGKNLQPIQEVVCK